jgi:formylmethanofuran dehydrogenase subunit E
MVESMETNAKKEFSEVVEFHGCYCLDIAMGYRVSKALMREMGNAMNNMKEVYAYVGAPTCAVDAIQKMTGCTLGKRNLILTHTGKSVFMMQNAKTGKAVRAYCHYWDHFDHEQLREHRKAAYAPDATPHQKTTFNALLDSQVQGILLEDEAALFSLDSVTLAAPPRFGKYVSEPCGVCGEFAKVDLLLDKGGKKLCVECSYSNGRSS